MAKVQYECSKCRAKYEVILKSVVNSIPPKRLCPPCRKEFLLRKI